MSDRKDHETRFGGSRDPSAGTQWEKGESANPAPTAHEPWMDEKASELAAEGTSFSDIAKALGIHWRTLYTWKKPGGDGYIASFAEALLQGRQVVKETIVMAMVKRAQGYDRDSFHYSAFQGDVTKTPSVEHYAPDVGAAKLLLGAWEPETYGDRSKVEHEGGLKIQVEYVDSPTPAPSSGASAGTGIESEA